MNDIIKEFNKISIDFLEQTSKHVGKKYLHKFKLATGVNSVYAIDRFIINVLQYKPFIVNKDETFFLNKEVSSEFVKDVEWIKDVYFKYDDESKSHVWDTVLALVCLAEERHNIKINKRQCKSSENY
jgi:hypothetical protein